MGLELTYQAIPPSSGLIELARSDVEDGWGLSLVPHWFLHDDGGPKPGREGEQRNRIWDACCQLAGVRPDLCTLNCNLDRRWDVLHFLLSATRRGERASESHTIIDRAFDEGEPIAEHVRGSQGIPVRLLFPTTVVDIAAIVAPLDHAALAAKYDPIRLESQKVYKFWADRSDEAEWKRIIGYLDSFQRFFASAASAGDAAIVCLD